MRENSFNVSETRQSEVLAIWENAFRNNQKAVGHTHCLGAWEILTIYLKKIFWGEGVQFRGRELAWQHKVLSWITSRTKNKTNKIAYGLCTCMLASMNNEDICDFNSTTLLCAFYRQCHFVSFLSCFVFNSLLLFYRPYMFGFTYTFITTFAYYPLLHPRHSLKSLLLLKCTNYSSDKGLLSKIQTTGSQ
jgi:hypothetical protein